MSKCTCLRYQRSIKSNNTDNKIQFTDREQQILFYRCGQMGLHFTRLVLPQQRHFHTERIWANFRWCQSDSNEWWYYSYQLSYRRLPFSSWAIRESSKFTWSLLSTCRNNWNRTSVRWPVYPFDQWNLSKIIFRFQISEGISIRRRQRIFVPRVRCSKTNRPKIILKFPTE